MENETTAQLLIKTLENLKDDIRFVKGLRIAQGLRKTFEIRSAKKCPRCAGEACMESADATRS